MRAEQKRALLYGHAVGDALGVPVEFSTRAERREDTVRGMRDATMYHLPAGTWSDDTSMTLALWESIKRLGYIDYDDIMKNFRRWLDEAAFTATGDTFDVGRGCLQAIMKYVQGIRAVECGGRAEYDNGNGSLMRILPMAVYFSEQGKEKLTAEDLQIIHDVSSLTHGHIRSHVACDIYVAIALQLTTEKPLAEAIADGMQEIAALYETLSAYQQELMTNYARILSVPTLTSLPEQSIKSTGYVVDTLEAVLWCLLTTSSYVECTLKAVNLGSDTDTIAAIAGGLAGLAYGFDSIPQEWVAALQNKKLLDAMLA